MHDEGSPLERNRQLAQAIALAAAGDQAARLRASELFRTADFYGMFAHHAAYGDLGVSHLAEAAQRLAESARAQTYSPRTAARLLNALIDLGPSQHQLLCTSLSHLQNTWAQMPKARFCLGVFRRSLTEGAPELAAVVASEALRSLHSDPERFLPRRPAHPWNEWILRPEERVIDELAAVGPPAGAALAAELTRLVDDQALPHLLRHRAAAALRLLDDGAGGDAAGRLRAWGVEDPGEPEPDANVVASVESAWREIEDTMRGKAPHLLDKLGPPLPPQDIALCRQILGINDAFAASLARHRYVRIVGQDFAYEDIRALVGDVDDETWTDDGDWGDVPYDAFEDLSLLLSQLRTFADHLDA